MYCWTEIAVWGNELGIKETGLLFRSDIQGLRAIAVGAVVAYHLGLPISGGFVGVDVFFVISGFVISRLIMREADSSDGFSFKNFYGRRIKRILPIFVVVTAATLIASRFLLSPFGEIQQISRTGTWAAFLAANEQLLREDTYLGLVSNPLRHLWSLAVEEQFYILFPVGFVAFLRLSRRSIRYEDRARFVMGMFVAISLVACISLSHSGNSFFQQIAFFSTFTRTWQFLVGVVAAVLVKQSRSTQPVARIFLASSSVVGLCWSFLSLNETGTYPGLWALLPTLSTAGILISSERGTLLWRMLSLKPLVLVGDISYGLYLWHWPVVVFVARQTELTWNVALIIGIFSILLSRLTYHFIERPFREFKIKFRWLSFLAIAASSILLLTSSLIGRYADSQVARAFSPKVPEDSQLVRFGLGVRDTKLNLVETCNDPTAAIENLLSDCSNGAISGKPGILVIGDSHAAAIGDGLFVAAQNLGVGAVGFFEYGCPFIDGYTVQRIEDCVLSIDRSIELIHQLKPKVVVIAQSYSAYLTLEQPATTRVSPNANIAISADVSKEANRLVRSFELRLREILDGSRTVVILEEVPFAVMPGTRTADEFLSHMRLLEVVNGDLIGRFRGLKDVRLVNVNNVICPNDPPCALDEGGKLLYWHKTHLNRNGSLRLTRFWEDLIRREVGVS
jgi:peptidoglycan/LPS O-acetylase OafA/YrhL